MKTYKILPGLLISGDFNKLPREQKLAELQKRHVESVVCLLRRRDHDLDNVGWLIYFQEPIPDAGHLNLPATYRAVDHVLSEWRLGKTVLVHCIAAENRSPMVAALALIKIAQMTLLPVSGRIAIQMVRDARPGALTNPVIVAYLEQLV